MVTGIAAILRFFLLLFVSIHAELCEPCDYFVATSKNRIIAPKASTKRSQQAKES